MASDTAEEPSWRQPLPPQPRGRRRRAQIVQATRELIDEHGPGASEVSIKGIADRAGASAATIYHYFPDVESVVAAVAADYMDELIAAVDPVLSADHDDPGVLLDTLVAVYRDQFAAHPGVRELWFDRRASPTVTRIHEYYRATLVDKLQAAVARLSPTPGTTRDHLIMVTIAGSLWELAFALDPAGDPAVIAELHEACAAYWRRRFGLRIPSPEGA
ncbi:TetR/AcrR family transcriptional regulator [Actinomycetospora sp. NBRC 106378]|uniref:TetR/AcrR family transcriptional regulator n=1 Tax=Actinomycetospora sp. NBRC 106378 TaxID=3032208 RepID=UPI002553B6EE|nr:TetR/AcrR family transcriptional regulator [Actinomycetospora sp. NBRC 106378]